MRDVCFGGQKYDNSALVGKLDLLNAKYFTFALIQLALGEKIVEVAK